MSRPISYTSAVTFIPVSSGAGQYAFTTSTNGASAITNAYTDADSTTAARLTVPTTASRTYQAYFNYDMSALSGIPSNATINSVTGRVKYYVTNTSRISSVSIQLYANTTSKGTEVTTKSTSAAVYNLTGGTWTLSELQNARLSVSATRGTSTQTAYLWFHGSDLTVNYSVNGTEYEITVTNSTTVTTEPTGTTYVEQGNDQEILFFASDLTNITIKDNGTVITPTQVTGLNKIASPTGYSDATFTTSYMLNPEYGCNSSANTGDYAQFTMRNQTSYHIYYDFPSLNIPSYATITSVSCSVKGYVTSASRYPSARLYSGTSAKGTAVNITSTDTTNVSNLTPGTWTATEFNNARLYFAIVAGSNNTSYYFRFYGATLRVDYTVNGVYSYAITNISSDHTITVEDAGQRAQVKLNGSWVSVENVYKRVSGSWVKQTNLEDLFNPTGTIYVQGN